MAGSIKGIIVEIGGDTSGLQKALSKVNSATSSLSKELTGINRLLKLDPKNTELLSQKQAVLSENIETTKNKLNQLKDIQAQAIEAEKNGAKISEENWRALQKNIESTKIKLNKLLLEQDAWNVNGKKIEEFGEKIVKVSSKIDNLGGKLTKTLTTSVLALGVASGKSAIDFESAFAGVEKTVDGTAEQMSNLKQGIRDMSKELPSSATEISAVAEAAGQLGIQTDNILGFSKVMIDMGNSTNLSSDEAATSLARFANITQMSQKDFDKLGSSIVDLGNNFATTESEIVDMALRLAGAGHQVGMSEGQILGLATALSSVGIEAEMGGSALSKAMVKMQNAVEMGGSKLDNVLKKTGMTLRELELMSANDSMGFKSLADSIGMTSTEVKQLITAGTNLEDFASISGMSAEQFKKAWKDDATGALTSFIKGLGDAENKGESAITMLSEMGLTEVRLRDSLLRAANAGNLFNSAIETGTKAWGENVALTNEANKRYETTESKLKITINKLKDFGTTIGNKLLPSINRILDGSDKWLKKLEKMDDATLDNIIRIGLFVAAAGPVLKILGKLGNGIGTVIKTTGQFSQAIAVLKTGAKSTSASVNLLAGGIKGLISPFGIASIAIAASAAAITYAVKKSQEDVNKAYENIGKGISNFKDGINNANSHLDSFNSTLFASNEEQQELKSNMDEVQKGITDICKRASDERRDYTQEEIKQLDEYFEKLRKLKDRELEIQQSVSNAIVQQATQNAESFQGSLDEYKVQSQEWIKTAQEQKDKEIAIINDRTTQEIALLQQRYGDKANLDNAEYAREYNSIIQDKDNAIAQANEKVSRVNETYANGYAQRAEQENGFFAKLKETNANVENENTRHTAELDKINNTWYATEDMRRGAIEGENARHNQELKNQWKDLYQAMSDSEEEQMGTWIAMLADTELYGGQINDESKKIVDNVISSYDNMPNGTRKAMKNAMQPMLEEMEKSEPSLFAKATSIANGILNKLKQGFDIHSPSRKTRKIFKYAMQGGEIELDAGAKRMYSQVDEISKKLLNKFSGMSTDINLGNINKKIIENTQTVFTTPQIVFNVNELDEARLQQCFNYINRKFGTSY